MLLELMLKKDAMPAHGINGFETAEFTHAAVAAYIAGGMADAGFGVETAAARFGLHSAGRGALLLRGQEEGARSADGNDGRRSIALGGFSGRGIGAEGIRCLGGGQGDRRGRSVCGRPGETGMTEMTTEGWACDEAPLITAHAPACSH
ncbi:substrate-binding domain-containing protein [Noviherbaspirillum album]|uniref:substrate-binding domain-containing protein n=1 Tax=Noviherbaspirillum album TaxID=3080276 RepID=UPI00345F6066